MKGATLAFGAFSLLQLAVAQPHRVRHAHQHKHVKKDADVVFTVIDTVYVSPTEAPDVIVFVNQFGVPLSTMTEGILESPPTAWSTAYGSISALPPVSPTAIPALSLASTSAPVVASSAPVVVPPAPTIASTAPAASPTSIVESDTPSKADPVVDIPSSVSTPATYAAPAPVSSSQPLAETGAASTSTSGGSGYGFSYSPYMADNSCKTQEQVNADFAGIGTGYSLVRIYGTDCNQTATVLTAAKAHKLKLFAGIFSLGSLQDEVNLISEAANGDWSSIDTVSVGNELVNSGTASPAAVVAAIGTVRGLLKNAGYTGKVVTVDTLVAARANPSLCDNSDFCAVNCHPFFDGNVAAKGSGDFLTTQIPTLRNVLANKNQEVVITETGWPWKGDSNNMAVPSPSNQADAISSIKSAFSSTPNSVILFTTFNDMWKTNTAAQFQAEQFWGFLGDAPSG